VGRHLAVRRTEDGSPDERFADLVGDDVKPVSGPRRVVSQRSLAPSPASREPEEGVEFSVHIEGEEVTGIAAGADPAQVACMRRGEIAWQRSVDLHGLIAEQARKLVRAEIVDAARAGERCLRVIHGRGHGSESGPVLKQALPNWLAELPHGRRVLGFCCARTLPGGTGATLVLLKNKRRSNRGS
jgi:DNA-nicking Smr family endonuclease